MAWWVHVVLSHFTAKWCFIKLLALVYQSIYIHIYPLTSFLSQVIFSQCPLCKALSTHHPHHQPTRCSMSPDVLAYPKIKHQLRWCYRQQNQSVAWLLTQGVLVDCWSPFKEELSQPCAVDVKHCIFILRFCMCLCLYLAHPRLF